jgi:dTDP-4-dehydrorhamnose 3,5-epimerase
MRLREHHESGWAVFESAVHHDERGWLTEALRVEVLEAHLGSITVAQQNLSWSRRGVLRGLHYQLGPPQGKLVRVIEGAIHDVIVDLRKGSKSFGQSFAFELSADDPVSVWVPPGFAHGFFAREDSLVVYALTQAWESELDRTIRWDSPGLSIAWPLGDAEPILSAKDAGAPVFDADGEYQQL